jgi:hypothetical protein
MWRQTSDQRGDRRPPARRARAVLHMIHGEPPAARPDSGCRRILQVANIASPPVNCATTRRASRPSGSSCLAPGHRALLGESLHARLDIIQITARIDQQPGAGRRTVAPALPTTRITGAAAGSRVVPRCSSGPSAAGSASCWPPRPPPHSTRTPRSSPSTVDPPCPARLRPHH